VDVVILADETITGSELPSNYKISGTATSLTAGKLVDSAANFLGPGVKVRIGDIVVNDDLATFAKVIAIDSPTQLALDTNIFTAEAQVYTLNSLILAGAVTATATNKLIDSAANFLAAQATVRIGDIVTNGVSSKQATVTAIDGTTQLSLNTDIFTVAAEAYTLKSLTTQVKEYIDDVRPVTASAVRVLPPAITSQDVTLAVSGDNLDKTQIGSEISAYISNLEPGETLYLSRLTAIAIEAGAINAVASVPAADVTPAVKEMLRPGTITVT
jgi:CxxC motif-containing protein